MTQASIVLREHMPIVFFGYGLAFFIFGLTILFQNPKTSDFKISRYLPFVGLFGVTHGAQEWTDMFLSFGQPCLPPSFVNVCELLSVYVGTISYVFLFLFGIHAMDCSRGRLRRVQTAASWVVVAMAGFLLLKYSPPEGLNSLRIAVRYVLAFPASLATAFALFRYSRSAEIANLHSRRVVQSIIGLAATFAVYALMAGLVVRPANFFPASLINTEIFVQWFAIPVQVIRALCAVAAAVLVTGVLQMFAVEWEAQRQAEIRRRIEIIGEMNHHIRNAMETITLSTFSTNGQANLGVINDSIHRIEWALKEILPKL